MKLKFVAIMTAFTLTAVSLTGLFTIPVLYAQEKPAAPPLMKVDHNHSTIGFAIPILGGLSKVTGKFTDFDLGVVYDEVDITKSSVNTTIRVASIDTGIADRDKDLRGAGFFDVEKFPTITFVSHSIEKMNDTHFVARGTFTMKGVSKEIDLPISLTGQFENPATKKKIFGFHSSIKINRRDYGITWEHQALATFVGDDVEVDIDIIS
jgi:polyisoprenoid-binding protein YceI